MSLKQLQANSLEYEKKCCCFFYIFIMESLSNLPVLLVLLQSLMLAERACVYKMLLNLMETREAGRKQEI